MFLGLGQGRDRNMNASTCWSHLEVGFKFFFIVSIVLSILSWIAPSLLLYFPNIIPLTVGSFQLWRLITSFMLPGIGQMMIINVLFQVWILYQYMPDIVSIS